MPKPKVPVKEKPFTNCAKCGEFKANALEYCGTCWFALKGAEDRREERLNAGMGFTTNPEPHDDLYEKMADGVGVDWSGIIDQAAERDQPVEQDYE